MGVYSDKYFLKFNSITKTNFLICLLDFILGISMVMNGGFYIFGLIDDTVTLISCIVILFFESVVISYYFGCENLNELCANTTGMTIPKYVFVSWKYISPAVLALFTGIAIIDKVI